MRNHGLLVWGNTVKETHQKILRFESEFKKVLQFSGSDLDEAKRLLQPGNVNRYLTPDHAVFLDSTTLELIEEHNFEPKWLKQMYDQLCMVLASSLFSQNLSWLDKEEVLGLRNWEAEKLRRDSNY